MKNYKILLISFVLLIFMIGAVSASDISDSAVSATEEDAMGDLPIIIIDPDDGGDVGGDVPIIIIDPDDGGDPADPTDGGDTVAPSGDIKEIYVNDTGSDENSGTINSPYATIGKAIADCNSSHEATIYLSQGTFSSENDTNFNIYLDHQLYGGNLKFIGAGADKTFIDGQSLYRFAYFAKNTNVTLKDITFMNFKSYQGAVLYSVGILTVENCIFKNTVSTSDGGGAISAGENSFFIGDQQENTKTLIVRNSQFISNSAISEGFSFSGTTGGAISAIGLRKLILDNNTFINSVNSATNCQGTAVYSSGADSNIITNNKFINITGVTNSRDASIFVSTADKKVSIIANNTFINCINPSKLYAIVYLNQGTYEFKNNNFVNSSNSMGSIYSQSASLKGFKFVMSNEIINITNAEINNGAAVSVNITDDMGNIVSAKGFRFKFTGEENSYTFGTSTNDDTLYITFSQIPENGIYNLSIVYGGEDVSGVLTTVNVSLSNDPVDVYVSPKGFGGNDGTHDSPFETIQQALDYGFAKSFTVNVHLLEGTYSGDENVDLTIDCKGTVNFIGEKYNKTVIDGENEHWFMYFSDTAIASVENLKFVNGYSSSTMIRGSNCKLINCIIDNCTVTNRNNAILYMVSFDNLTFTNNDGRIAFNYKEGKVSNSYFANNKYIDSGLINSNSGITVTNSKFINNTASNGGAIYANYVISKNNYYEGNSARNGGAIFLGGAVKSTFNNDTFINNKATDSNGAIGFSISSTISNTPKLFFEGCKFINNSAPTAGVLSINTGKFTSCSFINNTADYGGALRILIKENIATTPETNPWEDAPIIILGASQESTLGDLPFVNDIPIIIIDPDDGGDVGGDVPIIIIDPDDGGDVGTEEEQTTDIKFQDVIFENNNAKINGKDIYLISPSSYYLNAGHDYIYPIPLTINFNDLSHDSLAGNLIATVSGPCNSVVGGNEINFLLDGVKLGSAEIVDGVATFYYAGFSDGNYTLSGNMDYSFQSEVSDGKINVKLENILDSVDYWVSVNGSDENGNGSEANPFNSISYAVEKAMLSSRNIIIHIGEGIFAGELNTNLILSSYSNITLIGAGADKTIIDGENNTCLIKVTKGDSGIAFSDLTIQNMLPENAQKLATLPSYQLSSYNSIQELMYNLDPPIVVEEGATLCFNNVNVKNNRGATAIIKNNGLLLINNSVFEKNGLFAYAMILGGDVVIENSLIDSNFGVNNLIDVNSLKITDSVISNIFNTNGFSLISTDAGTVIENTLIYNDGDNTYLSLIGYDVVYENLNPAIGINDNVIANNLTMINNYGSPVTDYVYSYRHAAALSAFGYVYGEEAKNVTVKNSKFHNITYLYSVNTWGNVTFNFEGCLFDGLTYIGQSQTPGTGSTITITDSIFVDTPMEVNRMNRPEREDPVCIFENNYWTSNDKPVVAFANHGNVGINGNAESFEPKTWIVLVDENGVPVFKTTDGENTTAYEGSLPAEISYVADENGDVIPVLNLAGTGYKLSVDENGSIVLNTTEPMKNIVPKVAVNETVFADDVTVVLNDGSRFTARFTNKWGDPLKNTQVSFVIGDNVINATTDVNGSAGFAINFALGKYAVSISNPVTGQSVFNTISVIVEDSIFANDVASVFNDGSKFVANFTDKFGNVLANTNVTFMVGNDTINAVTDENGTASFIIAFNAGNYTVSAINPVTGQTVNKKIIVNESETKLKASSLIMYYNTGKYFIVTLKDANGNVLANQTVSIKINGRTFKKVTNAKGQANLRITLPVKNYYLTTVTFAGNDNYLKSTVKAKVIVKKVAPKLFALKKTYKVRAKVKYYSVILKTNKNQYMKKSLVTLKVNGKLYKAYTNAKGKAIFKITNLNKVGRFNALVKFAGNKNFRLLGKFVRITVVR